MTVILTNISEQLDTGNAIIEINPSLHSSQHDISIDEETGYLVNTPKSDWYGSFSPVYYFGYSAYYIDISYYLNNSVVVVGLLSTQQDTLYCGIKTAKKEVLFEGHLHKMTPSHHGTCASALWCPLPETVTHLPTTIQVKLNKTGNSIATVPIQIPEKPPARKTAKYRLLVCLKCLYLPKEHYENLSIDFFIEWVELNRILGVDHISVYIQNTTRNMEKILTYYAATGFLDLRSKQQEPGRPMYEKPRRHFGLNDCLYRNFHAYDRLVMIDSDELIVPHMEQDLDEMIRNIEKNIGKKTAALSFRNTVYFTDLPDNMVNKSNLVTIDALNHLKPEAFARKKYLVDPKQCLLAFTHYCRKGVPNGYWKMTVNESVAKSQHYKHCSTARQSSYKCNWTSEQYYHDPGVLRFQSQLQIAVSKVVSEVGL